MIGLVTAGIGLLASGVGAGISAYKNKKAKAEQASMIANDRARSEAWYKRNYYQDYLNTIEGQNALKKTRDAWAEQTREARARAAIMGGTPEQAQAVAEAGGRVMGDTISDLAAQGQANKQQVDALKLQQDSNIAQMEMEGKMQQYQRDQQMANNLMQSGMGAVTSGLGNSEFVDDWLGKLGKK